MPQFNLRSLLLALACMVCCLTGQLRAATPDVDAILSSGKLDEGVTTLEAYLADQPKDDKARFGLAFVQFVQAGQRITEKLSVYGPQNVANEQLRKELEKLPAPKEPLTYPKLRQFLQEALADLARVDATLGKIQADDVKLPLHVSRISLTLARQQVQAMTLIPFPPGFVGRDPNFVIAFDRADVDWLRGYCHLLSAVLEISLAYDGQELFDVSVHRIFKYAKTPHAFLYDEPRDTTPGSWFRFEDIADLIAAIHVMRFPVAEPKRMAVALDHVEQTIGLSRQMWKRVQAETDDDREWIPNPKQRGAINIQVTAEMVESWEVALVEFEQILQGKKLLPFWRGSPKRGVNLRKAFLEPRSLDVVLWVQGTAATPYLEEGEQTKPETWRKINDAFRGQFIAFGFWFN